MDQFQLQAALADLPLGAVKFFDLLGSTNDEAARWVDQGAADMALLVAEEQTSGRGRQGRVWYSHPGASLTFSLILYPHEKGLYSLPRLTALGALACCNALKERYKLPAQIKWPNDVLLQRHKVAGVLTEARWSGDQLAALILGIGINVAPESVAAVYAHPDAVRYPVACVETVAGRKIDRLELLHAVLEELLCWQPRLSSPDFILAWEDNLAFRGERVQILCGSSTGKDNLPGSSGSIQASQEEGAILGLSSEGALRLRKASGEVITFYNGEIRL